MSTTHILSDTIVNFARSMHSRGIGFDSIFRVTVGYVATIINTQVLHDDENCRCLYAQAAEVTEMMVKMSEGYSSTLNLSTFSAIYGEMTPLAAAIARDDENDGVLAVRIVDVMTELLEAWAAFVNDDGAVDQASELLTTAVTKAFAWNVAQSAVESGSPQPFDDLLGCTIVDDDYRWSEVFDASASEYLDRLRVLKMSVNAMLA